MRWLLFIETPGVKGILATLAHVIVLASNDVFVSLGKMVAKICYPTPLCGHSTSCVVIPPTRPRPVLGEKEEDGLCSVLTVCRSRETKAFLPADIEEWALIEGRSCGEKRKAVKNVSSSSF